MTDSGPVNADGCNAAQLIASLCPSGGGYRNHGAYVSCVAHATTEAIRQGLMAQTDHCDVVSGEAESDVGKKGKGTK